MTHEVDPPVKKTKVLMSKEAPSKDAPLVAIPRKLIDRVCDFGRVVDELSQIIDELRGEVGKLKEEVILFEVAVAKSQANKAT
ncbi:hypothetical protein BHE74_00050446 [Ensete ventricosum]|nr:hypothetical protein GW17_00034007 [Ensete ventricosum]RWW43848.1 hypothetical protein BHE74_00050446 [Ensete ventricosum]RZS29209.1 hypothetical protein BHM03_00062913 [Ensete ventricosum]